MPSLSINEDTVHAADENGNGDAKMVQNTPVKRRKSETANTKPRTKQLSPYSPNSILWRRMTDLRSFPRPVSLLRAGAWFLYSGNYVHMQFNVE